MELKTTHPTTKKDLFCGQKMIFVSSRKVQHDEEEYTYRCDTCGCWYSDYSKQFWHGME